MAKITHKQIEKKSYLIPFFTLLIVGLFGCQSNKSRINSNENPQISIETLIFSQLTKNDSLIIDTLHITNNHLIINGNAKYPVKAFLSIPNVNAYFPFILTNDSLAINLNPSNIAASELQHSPVNDEWHKIEHQSIVHFREISYLFPELQQARISNDYKALEVVQVKIDSLQQLQKNYLIDYLKQHPNSQLQALILNDLYKNFPNDSSLLVKLASTVKPVYKNGLRHGLKP